MPSAYIRPDGVYIHMDHIIRHMQDETDVVSEAMTWTHKHSNSKVMLSAYLEKNFFHILKKVERHPGSKQIRHHNVLYNTEASRKIIGLDPKAANRSKKFRVIAEDLDDRAYAQRQHQLGLEDYVYDEMMENSENNVDEYISTRARHKKSLDKDVAEPLKRGPLEVSDEDDDDDDDEFMHVSKKPKVMNSVCEV